MIRVAIEKLDCSFLEQWWPARPHFSKPPTIIWSFFSSINSNLKHHTGHPAAQRVFTPTQQVFPPSSTVFSRRWPRFPVHSLVFSRIGHFRLLSLARVCGLICFSARWRARRSLFTISSRPWPPISLKARQGQGELGSFVPQRLGLQSRAVSCSLRFLRMRCRCTTELLC
jgi:hypothetical protein